MTSDIPPSSPYHQSPRPRSSNRNAAGWLTGIGAALFAFLKYGGLLLLKIPALGTLVSLHKKLLARGRHLTVGNLSPEVHEVFVVPGLDTQLLEAAEPALATG